jgi:hypothetical protein
MRLPRAKTYPKTVHVGDEAWSVEFVDTLGQDTLGICDPSTNCIRILRGQTRRELFSTFVHEVLHAFEFSYDFQLKHKHVEKLEKAIVDFLLENF